MTISWENEKSIHTPAVLRKSWTVCSCSCFHTNKKMWSILTPDRVKQAFLTQNVYISGDLPSVYQVFSSDVSAWRRLWATVQGFWRVFIAFLFWAFQIPAKCFFLNVFICCCVCRGSHVPWWPGSKTASSWRTKRWGPVRATWTPSSSSALRRGGTLERTPCLSRSRTCRTVPTSTSGS